MDELSVILLQSHLLKYESYERCRIFVNSASFSTKTGLTNHLRIAHAKTNKDNISDKTVVNKYDGSRILKTPGDILKSMQQRQTNAKDKPENSFLCSGTITRMKMEQKN